MAGKEKIEVVDEDKLKIMADKEEGDFNCTYSFLNEDHTLGNILRYILMTRIAGRNTSRGITSAASFVPADTTTGFTISLLRRSSIKHQNTSRSCLSASGLRSAKTSAAPRMGSSRLRMFRSASTARRPSSNAAMRPSALSSPIPMRPILRFSKNAMKLRKVGYLRNSASVMHDARSFIAASRTFVPFTPLLIMQARSTSSGIVASSSADETIFMRSRGWSSRGAL